MIADAVSGVYDQRLRELNAIGAVTPSAADYLDSLAQSLELTAACSAVEP